MTRRDTARYAMLILLARWSIVVLGGIALVTLMLREIVKQDAGVPLLGMLIAGAGFSAIGTTPPAGNDGHEIEPVPTQRIAATLDPPEPAPSSAPAEKGVRAVSGGWKG